MTRGNIYRKQQVMAMTVTRRYQVALIKSRLLVNLMRASAVGLAGKDVPASECGDVLLICAVFIGQAEGRPMTAGKLAAYIGMPRPTVLRRLAVLESQGIFSQDDQRRWSVITDSEPAMKYAETAIVAIERHIQAAAVELSKLDT